MNVNIYNKHQKSRKHKYVATDPKTMKVIYSSSNRKEFENFKEEYNKIFKDVEDNE